MLKKPRKKKHKKIHRKKKSSIIKHSKVGMNGLEKTFAGILNSIGVKFKSQFIVRNRIYDFYLPEYGILIEVDGDYYHCNPRKYPNGPINKMQAKNMKNDKYKDALAKTWGFDLIRVWEYDIRNMKSNVHHNLRLVLENRGKK